MKPAEVVMITVSTIAGLLVLKNVGEGIAMRVEKNKKGTSSCFAIKSREDLDKAARCEWREYAKAVKDGDFTAMPSEIVNYAFRIIGGNIAQVCELAKFKFQHMGSKN